MDNQKLSDRVMALEGPDRDAIVERLISNPTLRPNEWQDIAKLLPFKKYQTAAMLCVRPETFSRILSGNPPGVPVEKLFRLVALSALMPREDISAKFAAMQTVVSLSLSPVELVK